MGKHLITIFITVIAIIVAKLALDRYRHIQATPQIDASASLPSFSPLTYNYQLQPMPSFASDAPHINPNKKQCPTCDALKDSARTLIARKQRDTGASSAHVDVADIPLPTNPNTSNSQRTIMIAHPDIDATSQSSMTNIIVRFLGGSTKPPHRTGKTRYLGGPVYQLPTTASTMG